MPDAVPIAKETDGPIAAARAARVRHVTDDIPGITRRRAVSGFDYRDGEDNLIRDFTMLSRSNVLAIPPAWTAVWIASLFRPKSPGCERSFP